MGHRSSVLSQSLVSTGSLLAHVEQGELLWSCTTERRGTSSRHWVVLGKGGDSVPGDGSALFPAKGGGSGVASPSQVGETCSDPRGWEQEQADMG